MLLRPDTRAMTALLALLTSLGPLSTDMYLPSLPDMARLFGTTPAAAQLTLSAFLAGFAIGQLLFGPLSDRYGRKPVLIASLALYAASTMACALAPTMDALVAFRFVQAFAACGAIVIARAIVRDLYSGDRAGQELARMGAIMGLVPALAPIAGGALHVAFGWTATFWVTALFAGAIIAAVSVALPETLARRAPEVPSPAAILRSFRIIGASARFRAYCALFTLAYAGLFAFISASSFVLQGVMGLAPQTYGVAFGAVVIGYISGAMLGARVTRRRGLDASIGLGVGCLAAGGALMAAAIAAAPQAPVAILGPMTIYTLGVGLVMPQAMGGALTPFPERAGAASSLVGFVQMSVAALVGIAVGHLIGSSAWPLVAAICVTGWLALAVQFGSRRARVG